MIYLCDSLRHTNDSSAEMKREDVFTGSVKNINQVQGNVICVVTIPGVEIYKSEQKTRIPKYPIEYNANKTAGKC